jgi:hypothetical protein
MSEEPVNSDSFLTTLLASFQARGISLPVVAIGLGLLLFIIALILAILNRSSHEPPKVVNVRRDPPHTPAEDDLQRKINALKQKEVVAPPASTVRTVAAPVVPAKPQPVVQHTVVKPNAPKPDESSSAATMMSRLRDRGVLDQTTSPTDKKPNA